MGDKLFADAGATGTMAASISLVRTWETALVGIKPGAGSGNYYRWKDDTGVQQGWHYLTQELVEPYTAEEGETGTGYWIELRFPIDQGGTLEGDYITVDVWNFAQSEGQQVTWESVIIPQIHVWDCNAWAPEDDYSIEDPGADNPFPCPDGTIVTVEDALCSLLRIVQNIQGYLFNVNTLVADMSGPWNATVGQAQEPIAGTLGSFVQQAVTVMSNYSPSGFTDALVDSGVTGDLAIVAAGYNYRIVTTTIPAYVGGRDSDPIVYEVARLKSQLGWYCFELDGMLTPWQQLIYADQYAIAPTPAVSGFRLHLMAGIVADVYSVVETYTPKL